MIRARLTRREFCNTAMTPGKKRPTQSQFVDLLTMRMKQSLRDKGLAKPAEPKWWVWTLDHVSGMVSAHTRSEARAEIKKELGVSKSKRLPLGIEISHVTPTKS